MRHRAIVGSGILVISALFSISCGGQSPATIPNPAGPAPTPTPTPVPVPTPTPTPSEIACGKPTPPPLHTFRVKVHSDMGYKKILDSRVLVGRDAAYCASLGYPGDICVVRDENAPDAITCGNLVAGLSSQTGRYGPNWYWNGEPCRPVGEGGDDPGCRQHPTNQFMVFAFGPGTFTACGDEDRVCFGINVK
jgi:hypothetical protein